MIRLTVQLIILVGVIYFMLKVFISVESKIYVHIYITFFYITFYALTFKIHLTNSNSCKIKVQ